ncbi:MAG: hypothetical protein IJ876_06915 [Elusimicrobiaceae bacterium]|nr:hypothetical protein [Elusimicrobiaceae bacterium]
MNIKKLTVSVLSVLLSVCAFAYPAMQDDDPVSPMLQQYAAQIQELQKGFDKKLLPTFKSLSKLALDAQAAGQTDLTPTQAEQLEQYSNSLDTALSELVAPALQDVDVAQFNEQYKQMAQTYGLPVQEFTLQDISDMIKGMYLISALGYFEQTQKLNADELTVLGEIFFPQEEEEEGN